MTKEQRRTIYWEMYTVAVGLDVLNSQWQCDRVYELSAGICDLIWYYEYDFDLEDLKELIKPKKVWGIYWYTPGNWNIRSKKLLDAIKKTY